MGLFSFFTWTLVMVLAVAVLWPVNVPLLALAYKIRFGYQPIPLERDAFWWRSSFAALALFALSLVTLFLAFLLVQGTGFPMGPLHFALLLGYLPASTGLVFWIYAMDDVLEAFGIVLVYFFLFGPLVMLVGRFFGIWQKWATEIPWLLGT